MSGSIDEKYQPDVSPDALPYGDNNNNNDGLINYLKKQQGDDNITDALARWQDEQTNTVGSITQFSGNFAVVSTFLAGLGATLISFAEGIFSGHDEPKLTDSIVYSCGVISIIIFIASVLFLSHSAVVVTAINDELHPPETIEEFKRQEREKFIRKAFAPARDAATRGMLLMYVAIFPLGVGLVVLVWADFTRGTALATSITVVLGALLFLYEWLFGNIAMYGVLGRYRKRRAAKKAAAAALRAREAGMVS